MGSSDSDTENECFESAEESLDEMDEVEDIKKKSQKNSRSSEREIVEPAPECESVDSKGLEGKHSSSNSLSFRKRPERMRRLPNKTPTRSTSKSPTSEVIFKADKIVPDVFFQDITTNLTKNINKSLSTLQQKSSNVKDLIFSSLPSSSDIERAGFSYDDKSEVCSTDEHGVSDFGAEPQNVSKSVRDVKEKTPEGSNKKKKDTLVESLTKKICSPVDKSTEIKKERKPPDTTLDNSEEKFQRDYNWLVDTAAKGDVCTCPVPDISTSYNRENKNDLVKEKVPKERKESFKNSSDKNSDVKRNQEKSAIEEINIENPVSESENKKQESESVTDAKEIKPSGKEDNSNFETNLETTVNEKNVSSETADSNILVATDGIVKGFNDPSEEISEVKSEGILKELKMALKNIVGEEQFDVKTDDSSNIINNNFDTLKEEPNPEETRHKVDGSFNSNIDSDETVKEESNLEEKRNEVDESVKKNSSSSENLKEETNLEEKRNEVDESFKNNSSNSEDLKEETNVEEKRNEVDESGNNNFNNSEALKEEYNQEEERNEVDESSKDGWDDFDFSDNEQENMTSESTNTLEEKRENVNNKITDKKSEPEIRSEVTKKVEVKEKSKESDLQHENVSKNAKQISNKNEDKQFTEPEPVPDDSWDWEDWEDETSQEKQDKVDVPGAEKPKGKNTEDEPPDMSKWSGWDTFGQKQEEKQGNWGLGSWGVDMLLNKATAVTQGISNVLEAGLGAPDPETLARMEKIEKEKWKEEGLEEMDPESEDCHREVLKKNSLTNVNIFPVAGLTSLVAGVTSKIVEHSKIQEIGSKVITGGLDTLETFGKKTMEVLQEGDPGLKNKRALLLGNNKPVLSQVLREAREKADRESKQAEEKELAKKCHFETLFDDFQGMVHLEALEMLSRQCQLKLEQIRSGMNSEEQEDLNGILEEVEQLCSLEDWDSDFKSSVLDFKTALQMAVEPLKVEISIKRITQIQEDVSKWLQTSPETTLSFNIMNQKFVATLAELTAATVQQFHKSGEMLSVKECRKTVEEVDTLSRLTNVLCLEIKRICEKFITLSHKTSSTETGDISESFAKNATVVMENSTSYIRQAFDLLIPVIQLGAAA